LAELTLRREEDRPVLAKEEVRELSRALAESDAASVWRLRALAAYRDIAAPDRVKHLWRYSDPARLVPSLLRPAASAVQADAPTTGNWLELPEAAAWGLPAEDATVAPTVLLVPGQRPRLNAAAEASGITIAPLFADPRDGELLGRTVAADSGFFAAINGMAWNAGLAIRVPAGHRHEQPLRVVIPATLAANLPRLLIQVARGAEITVIEEHVSGEHPDGVARNPGAAAERRVVAASEILVGDGARVQHLLLQDWDRGVNGHLMVRARVERDGNYLGATATFGGGTVKVDSGADLVAPGAQSELVGIALGEKRQHFDHHTVHRHSSSDTRSQIDFKVALTDRARSSYTGLIRIEPGAPRSEAFQVNRNLLLSESSRADSIPELEILTDDVTCSHGATVAPVDPEQDFYLQSRGLDAREALRLVVEGFLSGTLAKLKEDARRRVDAILAERLSRVAGDR